VIKSFNEDKPYDHLVQEQIVGDELRIGISRRAKPAAANVMEISGIIIELSRDQGLEEIMKLHRFALGALGLIILFVASVSLKSEGAPNASRENLLYVAVPGIRNYVEYGGIGILVYDINNDHRLVKRIPTFNIKQGQAPEPIKGICASARTGRLYLTTTKRMVCLDLAGEKIIWDQTYEGGCDRMAITPDGKLIYLPSFEGRHWHVVDGATGEIITRIEIYSGAHNTIVGLEGKRAYLAGLKSPLLRVVDTQTQQVIKTVGPFSNVIRPFTINGRQSLVFVNINDLLGFEVGDLNTGEKLYRVEVSGYEKGPVKRHGCPSHGIGLTPDEKELWLTDAANSSLHIFDATVMPPKQVTSVKLRDQPGWVTFSLDGRYAYPSTGEVIDVRTKRIVAALADESGKPVQSEKMVEVVWAGGKVVSAGDQFGLGRKQ